MPTRYTILLDEGALRDVERLCETYRLKNKADVYDLAIRVLNWATEQQIAGFEVGRSTGEDFQPLLLPYAPDNNRWSSMSDTPAHSTPNSRLAHI